MQSNYPSRLNLDLKNINEEKINKTFLELIELLEIRKLVYLKNNKMSKRLTPLSSNDTNFHNDWKWLNFEN